MRIIYRTLSQNLDDKNPASRIVNIIESLLTCIFNKQTFTFLRGLLLITAGHSDFAVAPKFNPIKFSIGTSATTPALTEEFEITITAEHINISQNNAYVLKDANNFKIKLTNNYTV